MFAQHEQILRDVFTRVAADSAGLAQRVAQLEHGHLESAKVVTNVVAGLGESVSSDSSLRRELNASDGRLAAVWEREHR